MIWVQQLRAGILGTLPSERVQGFHWAHHQQCHSHQHCPPCCLPLLCSHWLFSPLSGFYFDPSPASSMTLLLTKVSSLPNGHPQLLGSSILIIDSQQSVSMYASLSRQQACKTEPTEKTTNKLDYKFLFLKNSNEILLSLKLIVSHFPLTISLSLWDGEEYKRNKEHVAWEFTEQVCSFGSLFTHSFIL